METQEKKYGNEKAGHRLPRARFKAGGIQAAIWDNVSREGQLFQTITIDRRYKAGEDWKSTKSLRANDLPKAILALEKAYEYLALKRDDLQSSTMLSPTEQGKGLVKLLA